MIMPILLGIILAITHFTSEKFHLLKHIQKMKFISFSSGIFISYFILHLFPDIFVGDIDLNRISLVFVLIGFSMFHLLEKYIYSHHEKNKEILRRELKEIHSIAFFIYHIILGIVLTNIINLSNILSGILFFFPLLFVTAVSSLSLKTIHGMIRQKMIVKIFLSISSLIGVFIALIFPLTKELHAMLLGFVVGILLFTMIVDSIPRERKGYPIFFILGVSIYSLLIGITWLF